MIRRLIAMDADVDPSVSSPFLGSPNLADSSY